MRQAAISEGHALSVANGKMTLQQVMKGPVDELLPAPVEIIAFSEEEGLRCIPFFSARFPASLCACLPTLQSSDGAPLSAPSGGLLCILGSSLSNVITL